MSDRPIVPLSRVSARIGAGRARWDDTRDKHRTARATEAEGDHVAPGPRPPKGTLGGSNRLLSARDVAAILGIPERTVRDKWREW